MRTTTNYTPTGRAIKAYPREGSITPPRGVVGGTQRQVRVTRPWWQKSLARHYYESLPQNQPPVRTTRMTEEERLAFLKDVEAARTTHRKRQGTLSSKLDVL